jgi:hypothetical protein
VFSHVACWRCSNLMANTAVSIFRVNHSHAQKWVDQSEPLTHCVLNYELHSHYFVIQKCECEFWNIILKTCSTSMCIYFYIWKNIHYTNKNFTFLNHMSLSYHEQVLILPKLIYYMELNTQLEIIWWCPKNSLCTYNIAYTVFLRSAII